MNDRKCLKKQPDTFVYPAANLLVVDCICESILLQS